MSTAPIDLQKLPLVLTGPVLRRVDPTSTTVFLALREPRLVTLEVFQGDPASGGPSAQSGSRRTERIAGSSLNLVAVTAKGTLQPGTLYTYQVTLTPLAGGTSETLLDPGVVASSAAEARAALTYPNGPSLPSFVAPPLDPGGLRLLHGSCRKPHGEGFDALPAADAAVRDAIADPRQGPRPHQLLLTGDQIYADDVADALLEVIQRLTTALSLPLETMPVDSGVVALPDPGHRQSASDDVAMFSSTEAKSHLFGFAEFAGMYLLVWSPTCWPPDLASFRDVHPTAAAALDSDLDPLVVSLASGWASQLLLHYLKLADAYDAELKALSVFRAGLVAVRRAMANIPTFMIFDDHEITDDWNIYAGWVTRASLPNRQGSFGRQVIRNGLCAFALFQAWGNTPELFPEGSSGGLLTAIGAWRGQANAEAMEKLLGLPTELLSGVPMRPENALTYHFSVQWPQYLLIALDTRTFRVFTGGPTDPPALLYGDNAYAAMVTSAGDAGPDGVNVVIAPAPVFGFPIVEDLFQPAAGAWYQVRHLSADGKADADPESWSLHSGAFEKLLSRLITVPAAGSDQVRRRRVVLLSGDVHYASSVAVRWSASQPFRGPSGPAVGAFAQLVASPCKNESGRTRRLHLTFWSPVKDRIGWSRAPATAVGTETIPRRDRDVQEPVFAPPNSPSILEPRPGLKLTEKPEWQWHAAWVAHQAPPVAPAGSQVAKPTAGQQALEQYKKTARVLGEYATGWGGGKHVVGVNNLGDVGFVWPAGDAKQVVHTLWWHLPGRSVPSRLTRHVVDMPIEGTP